MNHKSPRDPSLIQRIFPRQKRKQQTSPIVLQLCEYCFVCGETDFSSSEVLWQQLIEDWKLSVEEVAYINRQQGTACMNCHNNLRSIALAKAIVAKYNFKGSLSCFLNTSIGKNLKILSVNTAGGLHKTLNKVKNYKLAEFPEHDMTNLGFEDGTFDLVIHSDTLEHVPSPLLGLQECRRVLADGGSCIFTIPIIIGRLSVDRKGKKASYHGNSDTLANDWVVQTEYGADAWTDGFRAGFSNVQIHCLEYPSAFAMQLNK